jgi:hypothetical protein
VRVQVHFFYTCDSNLTRSEPGLGAGFIFHPQVHPKPQKIRNPEEKNRKEIKKPKRNLFIKPDGHPNPTRKPTGSGVKFNPITFFHGSGFRSTQPIAIPTPGLSRSVVAASIYATPICHRQNISLPLMFSPWPTLFAGA